MNKIKDIIYNKSDVLVALIILAIAAAVILWRLDIILEYPKKLISGGDGEGVITTMTDTEDAGSVDNPATETDSQSGSDSEQNDHSGNAGGEEPAVTEELWVDGKLSRDVQVDVHGSYASAAVQCLIDEGLFEDYADYKNVCDDAGYDDEKVKAGDFTFEKGSTKKDIAKKINWGV